MGDLPRRDTSWRPDRHLEIVAGTGVGGGLDRVARALAATFEESGLVEFGVGVVNIPGEGARRAWGYLDARPADPNVLAISSANLTTDYLLGKAAFGPFTYPPIACLITEYIAFAARSDSSMRGGQDLLERLADDPAQVVIALSTSFGNPNHLALSALVEHVGQDIGAAKILLFDSAVEAVSAVIDGQAEVAAVTAASLLPELNRGRIRPLTVSSPDRLQGAFANTPTCREYSVDCVIGAWRGVAGSPGISEAQIRLWTDFLDAAVQQPAWAAKLAENYWSPLFLRGLDWHSYLDAELASTASVLARIGLGRERGPLISTGTDADGKDSP